MTSIKLLILSVSAILLSLASCAQHKTESETYVLVHGAWGGGWSFQTVDSLLDASGHTVYRPTLTGLGERVHLASPDVGLETHILDIVNTILFKDLHDIVLVGHSYGGMVVTGVADSIPDRIKALVYLDAYLPEDGESMISIKKLSGRKLYFKDTDGYAVPTWVPEGKNPPMDTPHPYKTLTDSIHLKNSKRDLISSSYIHTVEEGKTPESDGFYSQAERARLKGWPVMLLTADHVAQWSAPVELAKMLEQIAREH